jgi:hypothetical protein
MTLLTETIHPGAFIVSESEGPYHTRESVVIAVSQTIIPGAVLGRAGVTANETSSMAADASNTGNGVATIDATTPVLAGAKNGKYRVVNDKVATDSGEFQVFDPDGHEIGRVAVGATFANEIKFAIADGSTDFAIGDAFTVIVGIEQSDYQYEALDLTKVGDEAKARGFAVYGVTTSSTVVQKISAIVRGPCEVRLSDLTWPSGITAAQQAEGIRQLDALGIVCR